MTDKLQGKGKTTWAKEVKLGVELALAAMSAFLVLLVLLDVALHLGLVILPVAHAPATLTGLALLALLVGLVCVGDKAAR